MDTYREYSLKCVWVKKKSTWILRVSNCLTKNFGHVTISITVFSELVMAEVPALNSPEIQASHWATANAINQKNITVVRMKTCETLHVHSCSKKNHRPTLTIHNNQLCSYLVTWWFIPLNNPSYKWTNPTYPIETSRVITHLRSVGWTTKYMLVSTSGIRPTIRLQPSGHYPFKIIQNGLQELGSERHRREMIKSMFKTEKTGKNDRMAWPKLKAQTLDAFHIVSSCFNMLQHH